MTFHIEPEKSVPYPQDTEPEEATTLRENMQIAANTAAVLQGMGAEVEPTSTDQAEADAIFANFAERAKQQYAEALTPDDDKPEPTRGRPPMYPPHATPVALEKLSVADRISNMLRDYNNTFVADAAELRLVVTNKLLDLAACGDPRIEIKATEMLGKISDVGLFSDKTEITVTYNSVSDIDEAIKDKIRKMMRMNSIDITPVEIDIMQEFGAPNDVSDAEMVELPVFEQPATPPEQTLDV